jgi:hypothetical protein
LIDTPGFDDTSRSDIDALNIVAAFLETSYVKLRPGLLQTVITYFSQKCPMCRYERGGTLAGVLYFHRISDFKMTGASKKNFTMFKELCGDDALKNVVVVTNMWGQVEPEVGNAREAELVGKDIFFKPVLEKGARMARQENTVASAEHIVRLVFDNHPLPLRIQKELVDERKDISETGAGKVLNQELNAQIEKNQEEIHMLKGEMEQAIKDKDEETKEELELETQRMQKEIEKFQNDSERLESDYKKEKERLKARMEPMELEAKKEMERVKAEYQRKMDNIKNTLQTNAAASESERAKMLAQIDDLSKTIKNIPRRRGPFSMVRRTIKKFIF